MHRYSFSTVDDEQRKNLLNKWLIVVFRANSTAPVEKEGLFKPPFLPEPFNRSTCIMQQSTVQFAATPLFPLKSSRTEILEYFYFQLNYT